MRQGRTQRNKTKVLRLNWQNLVFFPLFSKCKLKVTRTHEEVQSKEEKEIVVFDFMGGWRTMITVLGPLGTKLHRLSKEQPR
jgi:hypothetical protein